MIFRALFGILLISITLSTYGQEIVSEVKPPIDSTQVVKEDPEKSKPAINRDLGIFLAVSLESAPHLSGRRTAPFYGAGVEFEGFLAGVYATTAIDRTERTLIFPNTYNLLYAFGGGYLGKRIWSKEKVQIDLLLNVAKGNMLWERSDNHIDFIEDRFVTWEPELNISYSLIPLSRVFMSIGYRGYSGLKLEQVNPTELAGVTFNLGFKFGIFTNKVK